MKITAVPNSKVFHISKPGHGHALFPHGEAFCGFFIDAGDEELLDIPNDMRLCKSCKKSLNKQIGILIGEVDVLEDHADALRRVIKLCA